jgi:hypothetical protein
VNLHPQAVTRLRTARLWLQWAGFLFFLAEPLTNLALGEIEQARLDLIDTPSTQRLAAGSAS